MDVSSINQEKIKDINEGLWTVTRNEFYVEIQINVKSDNKTIIFDRLINQNELAAIETQINISKLAESDDENNQKYKIFIDHLNKMKEYQKVVEYFSLIGIREFRSTRRQKFVNFEKIFPEKWINYGKKADIIPIYENCPKATMLTSNIQHSTFRIIGEYIQSEDYNKLQPYIKCVLGADIPDPYDDCMRKFKARITKKHNYDILFDSFKLGHQFCEYISNPKNVNASSHFSSTNRTKIIESIRKLTKKENSDFVSDLEYSFSKNNLIFIKVIRPVHCYHCIRSMTRILSNTKFYLNEKSLIFCQNGGDFIEKINKIARTAVDDSKAQSKNPYFIVHPEKLNEEEHSFLVEFLNARLNSITDSHLPKVFVISSFNYKTFCEKHIQKFNNIEFEISNELIDCLCKLSYPDSPDDYRYQLYYSENAGSGKTYQIIQDFKNLKNCKVDGEHKIESLFVDINMTKIPKLDYGNNKEYRYLHLDLSPELFDTNYQFFDNLWIFAILHFQINPDGSNTNTPPNIFFEVPTLTKKQFPDGGFIKQADFPIFCNNYHKISAIKNGKQSETKDDEKDDKQNEIKISGNFKKFCDDVFKDTIEKTSDLLKIISHMFYPDFNFDELRFVPRILEEINIFMEKFCNNLSTEDEKSKAIFLLLLRTNFHVWSMDSLFNEKSQPKSFIIIANQSLLSKELDKNKWILLCFSSIDEKIKWNTECLKDDIGPVDELKFFENNFFKKLLNDPNIDIYSNQLNYDDDQAYFFSIIKNIFYYNPNKDVEYRRITDGVILNDINNSDSFRECKKMKIFNYFQVEKTISKTEKIYKASELNKVHEWTKVFEAFSSIFIDYKLANNEIDIPYLIEELTNNEKVKQISNITLTLDIVRRFVIMIIRIVLKQPLIFEGFTGIGKTWIVKLLKMMIEISQNNSDFKWVYHQVDCHGALILDELKEIREFEVNKYPDQEINHIFFFDELNTSPVSCYVINEMNNFYLKMTNLPQNESGDDKKFNKSSIVFIAAINPHIKVDKLSRSFSIVGIKQIIPSRISKLKLCNITPDNSKNFYEVTDLNKLAYNVRELSESTKMIVIKSDSNLFYVTKNDLKLKSSIYLPPDEIKTIDHIIDYYFNSLISQANIDNKKNNILNSLNIEDEEFLERNLETINETLIKDKKKILTIIHSLLCKSFIDVRELMYLKSILSYRDVKRCMQFFIIYFKKLIKVYFKNKPKTDITNEILEQKIIPQSIVLSIMISIVFRFSNETRIEVSKNLDHSNVNSRCQKFGLKPQFSKDGKFFKVSIRSALLKNLNEINWEGPLNKPSDWNQIVINYSWLKCMKYIYSDSKNDKKTIKNSSLFKLNSLLIHLFAITSCYSACKNNKDCVIPCLIIGMPGTSKTLAIQLFTNYKTIYSKNKSNFYNSTYLSTRVSEAEGLNAHYRDCSMFMMTHKNGFSVCVIDELGLVNLNETRPSKLLHYYFDKGIRMESKKHIYEDVPVMSIAASNYALDYANMNRGILICTDLPTDRDISEAFYFSELEADGKISMIDYASQYFDNVENFFEWRNKKECISKYEKFLNVLWQLTEFKERPEMLTLRPLYLLFNSIFHNKKRVDDNELISNLCLYLISAISCKPSDSFEKLSTLLGTLANPKNGINDENAIDIYNVVSKHKSDCFNAFKEMFEGVKKSKNYKKFCSILKSKECNTKSFTELRQKIKEKDAFKVFYNSINSQDKDDKYYKSFIKISKNNSETFNSLISDINNPRYDNYKILRQSIISNLNGSSKRALCIRTKNYECLDFIEELLNETTLHYLRNKKREIDFTHIYPSDFKVPRLISADKAIEDIIELINSSNGDEQDTLHYVLIIGNVCLTDSLLDLLNSPSEGKAEFKTNKPLISRNGFSVQLNEYPRNIVFCFIMNESDFLNRNSADSFPVPLLDRLNQIYLDYDQRDEFNIIEKYQKYHLDNVGKSTPYAEIIHEYFGRFIDDLKKVPVPTEKNKYAIVFKTSDTKIKNEIKAVSQEDYEFDEKNKILLFSFYRSMSKKDEDMFDMVNDIETTDLDLDIYWSNEYNKLYVFRENFNIPYPEQKNFSMLKYDGSINHLLYEFSDVDKAIILTTSPMMEDINFKLFQGKGIDETNTLLLFDQYITSGDNMYDRIESSKKENVIVQLNHFQIDHDRYLRYLLEQQEIKGKIIIIYHLKNSIIPEGIFTSKNWPVFWIESISNSPLSEFPTTEIVECIRFRQFYNTENKRKDIYLRIFRQVYKEIDSYYDDHIDADRVEPLFEFIFDILNNTLDNQKSILDSVVFNDLIDKFEGIKIENSFKTLDFKREFYNSILKQIRFLDHLIRLLILNQDVINKRNVEDTKRFIQNIFNISDIELLFDYAEIDKREYQQLNNNGLYFPEIILPQVIYIYKHYLLGDNNYSEINISIFDVFLRLQVDPPEDYLVVYANYYFMTYLSNNQRYDEDKFKGFPEKLQEMINQQLSNIFHVK